MKVYLAASYSRREELCAHRESIRLLGHEVIGRWLDGNHYVPEGESPTKAKKLRARFAREDIEDLSQCQLLVSFTGLPEGAPNTGGRHVELGYAMGRAIPCICVGPKENVFHYHPWVEFNSFQEVLDYLKGEVQ